MLKIWRFSAGKLWHCCCCGHSRQRLECPMRRALALATVLVVVAPAAARAQTGNSSVQGFGGMTFGTSSFLPKTSAAPTLGGVVAVGLTDNIQAIGEIGRMSN